jgi:predicted AAA+ superfamily ATPase
MYPRYLEKIIEKNLFQNYILIIYGARQVGKTTLVKSILDRFEGSKLYLNCDEINVRLLLESTSYTDLKNKIGEPELLVIDEAQRVENIGLTLKILFDNNPKIQIIATGSSSFDFPSAAWTCSKRPLGHDDANKINEPLTGRSLEFKLFPLSITEIVGTKPGFKMEADKILPRLLKYGSYPKVVNIPEIGIKPKLEMLTNQYLYKDIMEIEKVKKPNLIIKLLKVLAYQVGSEVSMGKLANMLDCDKGLVERYIDILEKSFVIFKLDAYSTNKYNEIVKTKKIYFYDLGMRNALISSYPEVELNVGGLWENFLIVERMKYLEYNQISANTYFWRNYSQQEIDYLEEKDRVLHAFEFKWGIGKKAKLPNSFATAYSNHTFKVINKENWLDFVTE